MRTVEYFNTSLKLVNFFFLVLISSEVYCLLCKPLIVPQISSKVTVFFFLISPLSRPEVKQRDCVCGVTGSCLHLWNFPHVMCVSSSEHSHFPVTARSSSVLRLCVNGLSCRRMEQSVLATDDRV